MEVLRVEGLSKNFGGLQVLQKISFTAEAGEKLAIIGPNGAGKTTLFNVLGGQLTATTGHVYLCGQEITSLAPHQRLHLGLARSFHRYMIIKSGKLIRASVFLIELMSLIQL